MTEEMGTADRVTTTSLAVIIIVLLLNGSATGFPALIPGVFAAAFLGTSATRSPLYKPFGSSAGKIERQ
jgi:hypothetical protein